MAAAQQPRLSHTGPDGSARMVDVAEKPVTHRVATATAFVAMRPETLALIVRGDVPKGDVLATARIAGIMAAKRTAELIPLCHTLPLSQVSVDFEPVAPSESEHASAGVRITATAAADARTGVEMEALTAAAIAGLTVYDMCKAVDRGMTVGDVVLVRKEGGASGTWTREEPAE